MIGYHINSWASCYHCAKNVWQWWVFFIL